MTMVPLSVSMRALYLFLGSICIGGGFFHCFAIYFLLIIFRAPENHRDYVSGGTVHFCPAVEAHPSITSKLDTHPHLRSPAPAPGAHPPWGLAPGVCARRF